MGDRSSMGTEFTDWPSVPRIPDLHFSIPSSRDQEAAVGTECRGSVFQSDREREFSLFSLIALWIPDLDGKLIAVPPMSRGNPPVGVPGHAEHNLLEAGEPGDHLVCLHIPDLGGIVVSSGGNLPA